MKAQTAKNALTKVTPSLDNTKDLEEFFNPFGIKTYIEKIEYKAAEPKAIIRKAHRRRNIDLDVNLGFTLDLQDLLKTCKIWAVKFFPKKKTKIKVSKTAKGRLLLAKFLDDTAKRFLKEIRKWIKELLEWLKHRGILPKDLKELLLWLLKARSILETLKEQYLREIQHLLVFIALFDLMRFRILSNMLDAYYKRKWKVLFSLLKNFLRVPLVMMTLSVLKKDPYGGATALATFLPVLFFAKFRIPFLTDSLELLFSEIFAPEEAMTPIRTIRWRDHLCDPFRARRILGLLVDKNKK